MLELVRATYCGQPGERETAVESELIYTIPGMWTYISGLLPVQDTPAA